MSKPLTIAITGLNAIDSPGPGIGVARALKDDPDLNPRIIGLSYESLEPGVYMHDVIDKSYQIPYPSAGSEALFNRLMIIHEKEKLDLVIPNFDSELFNFIRLAGKLASQGIFSFLPSHAQLEALDKMHLSEFGLKNQVKTPHTAFITSLEEAKKVLEEFEFPLMVKGKFYEAFQANSEEQMAGYFHKLSAKWGLPVVLQQMVHGTEIDVAGLGDGEGNLIGAIPMRKLYITDKGKGWSGVVLDDPELITLAQNFCTASQWRGGFELEYIKTNQDEFYLLEVNPRFPAWIYTTAAAGQNLPSALVKLALHLPFTPFNGYQPGKMFVRYAWDLITDIDEFHKISTLGEL